MQTVRAGEFDVEYLAAGAGPAVILLHASASGVRQWRKLFEELQDSYFVLAVNLFGYGKTSPWPDDRVQTLADQAVLAGAAASIIKEPVTLVGHSLGGAVALETALALGDRLQGVIVFEPILFSLLKAHGPVDAFAEIQNMGTRFSEWGWEGDWDRAGEWFIDYWSGVGAWSAMSEERKAGLRTMLPNVLHEWDAMLSPARFLPEWGQITAPVHILRAADTRYPTHAIASLMTETHRHWHLHELAAGGHMAPLARPDLVNPAIEKLLEEVMK